MPSFCIRIPAGNNAKRLWEPPPSHSPYYIVRRYREQSWSRGSREATSCQHSTWKAQSQRRAFDCGNSVYV